MAITSINIIIALQQDDEPEQEEMKESKDYKKISILSDGRLSGYSWVAENNEKTQL